MVAAVHDPRSIGVRTYVERLSAALSELGIDYRPAGRPTPGEACHFHLANSTRSVVVHAARWRAPFLVTVHDVIPRTAALAPVHRALIVPLCVKRASRVIVHSRHAAELLADTTGVPPSRVEIVPFPAPTPRMCDRAAARAALGLEPYGPPLFVLPGALKAAKLIDEVVTVFAPLLAAGRARLVLAGEVLDEQLASRAVAAGARVLRAPAPLPYEHVIVAADAVLSLRANSVGESNGPVLDAIGAGRPCLVTDVGSAPEVAEASARVVQPTLAGIRAGIEALLDRDEREARAHAARDRAAQLTWAAAAERHAELFEELGRG